MGWLSFLIGQGMAVVVWSTLVFGRFRILVPLLVGVVGGRGWEMLAGKGGWGKGLYGPFVVYGRCMDMLLKGFFLL